MFCIGKCFWFLIPFATSTIKELNYCKKIHSKVAVFTVVDVFASKTLATSETLINTITKFPYRSHDNFIRVAKTNISTCKQSFTLLHSRATLFVYQFSL